MNELMDVCVILKLSVSSNQYLSREIEATTCFRFSSTHQQLRAACLYVLATELHLRI